MDQSNFMMALLILGPHSIGKDFDIFMESLVEELLLRRVYLCLMPLAPISLIYVLQSYGASMIFQHCTLCPGGSQWVIRRVCVVRKILSRRE
jgi:hypothetical protein